MIPAALLAAAVALPRPLRLGVAAPEDFCFPDFATVTARVPLRESSVIATEQLWTAPFALRSSVGYSGTPFSGGQLPPSFQGPTSVNSLTNFTSQTQWYWYSVEGKNYCNKQAATANDPALCIGADLSLNSTRIVGGQVVYSWVGFEAGNSGNGGDDCWHELLINSVESTDPARWLSSASQCVTQATPPTSYSNSIPFYDFSTAPFFPSVFELPAFCEP